MKKWWGKVFLIETGRTKTFSFLNIIYRSWQYKIILLSSHRECPFKRISTFLLSIKDSKSTTIYTIRKINTKVSVMIAMQ